LITVQLLINLSFFISFSDHDPHTDENLKDSLPQRKHILELLPLNFGDPDDLVKDADLCEPHNVVEEVVIVRANT
jgi:hypothetical protein